MRTIVFYATREGQTRRIAEHVAMALGAAHVEVDLHNVKTPTRSIDWAQYHWACVAASVHVGHHEPEMVAFVKAHRQELQRMRGAFLSVTLSQAGAQDASAPRQRREQAAADAQRMIDVFVHETGWRPARSLAVAGALAYSQYNVIVRFVMKRIARKAGAPTDTSRDYEFTDWSTLDRFIRDAAPKAPEVFPDIGSARPQ